jgi:hypothetical protein
MVSLQKRKVVKKIQNQYLNDLKSKYKPTKEAIEFVKSVLKQDDSRYSEPWSTQMTIAGFIANGAISIESEKLTEPKECEIPDYKGPQKDLKRIAARLLKDRDFVIVGCEVRVDGSVADIVASRRGERIIVECGPCRIDKPIVYLEKPNTKLWVLKRNDEKTFMLYMFTRGKRWDEFNEMLQDEFHNIQNSYDRIMEDI